MTVTISPTVNSILQNAILSQFSNQLEIFALAMPLTSFDVHPTAIPDEWLYKAIAVDTRNFRRKINRTGVDPYFVYSIQFNGTNDFFTIDEFDPNKELQNRVIQLISSGVTDISITF